MFDITFAYESLRRRWWVIVLVTLIACVAGIASMLLEKTEPLVFNYTAEAVFHINVNGLSGSDDPDGTSSGIEEYIANDARRIVLNSSVAGEVRREMGEDIVISTPIWQNDLTKLENKTMFIFVDAEASTEQTALDAANMTAELAVDRINEKFNDVTASISDPATIKTRSSGVADYGKDSLTTSLATKVSSSISWKKLVIYAGAGIIIACAAILIVEYCRRRIRSAHDVERLLGVTVLESISKEGAPQNLKRCAGILEALATRNEMKRICLIGWPNAETPAGISEDMNALTKEVDVVGWAGMSSPENDVSALSKADSAVLVISQNEQTANQLDSLAKMISALKLPILGALYLEK